MSSMLHSLLHSVLLVQGSWKEKKIKVTGKREENLYGFPIYFHIDKAQKRDGKGEFSSCNSCWTKTTCSSLMLRNVTSLSCQINVPLEQGDKDNSTHIMGRLPRKQKLWDGKCCCGGFADGCVWPLSWSRTGRVSLSPMDRLRNKTS